MLMFDRITHISSEGGEYGKGEIIAENLSKATDKMIEKNLMFNADKVGSPIIATMSKKGAKAWF
jgi:hypothetical protein